MTNRLPFRASDVRKPSKPAGDGERALTVTELAGRIDAALRTGVPGTVRVEGEVSGFRDRTHWYFDIKDQSASVSCVLFASAARRQREPIADGVRVVVHGRVDWYAKGGKLSLIASKVEPVGRGDADAELRRLVERAREMGWLDPETKRPLPRMPRRIAVVTSRTSAGLQDVLDTLRRRSPSMTVLLVDARVQGDAALTDVVRALRGLRRHATQLGIDAVLLTRGGGSAEDLWCFNDWSIAEAIRAVPVPVVAAIGHETDTTLAELVADERCATPTQAAVRLTPDRAALAEQADAIGRRLRRAGEGLIAEMRRDADTARTGLARAMGDRLTRRVGRLDRLALRLARVRPDRLAARARGDRLQRLEASVRRAERASAVGLAARRSRLDRAATSLRRVMAERLSHLGESVHGFERELHAVNPLEVLRRGYSVTVDADGRVVREPGDVSAGDRITTRLESGSVESVVGGDGKGRAKRVSGTPSARRRSGARPDSRSGGSPKGGPDERPQMDLFQPPG